MRLFIAEKPSVGYSIAEFLLGRKIPEHERKGRKYYSVNDDTITWCFGHILEQCDPEDYDANYKVWRLSDLPIVPKVWKLKEKPDAKEQLKIIKGLLSDAELVIHAGDPDREGQLLVDEVLEELMYKREVKRIWLSATDEKSVDKALSDLKDNGDYKNLRDSAQARSWGDWLVGMNATRKMTLLGREAGLDGVLSVGRVQTPTLSLVVARDRAIVAFKSKDFFSVKTAISGAASSFAARWVPGEDVVLDEAGRLLDRSVAEGIANKLSGKEALVREYEAKERSEAQPLAPSLDKLQMECNRRFGLSAQQTLEITQRLYEQKLVSYPRTDTGYLPENQFGDAAAILSSLSETFPREISAADSTIRAAAWNDKKVTAHHGIIPTGVTAELTGKEGQVYDFIARRFIALFYPPHRFLEIKVDLTAEGERLAAKGRRSIDEGWKVLFSKDAAEEEGEQPEIGNLPELRAGQNLTIASSKIELKKTTPPQKFTEASLLQAMLNIHQFETDTEIRKRLKETSGIGTPATRANIIETLKKRGFVEEKKKSIVSTAKGQELIGVLPASVKSPGLTALFEELLEGVAKGELTKNTFLEKQVAFVTKFIEADLGGKLKATGHIHTCPDCKKSPLRKRAGKSGNFWGCSAYPDCKGIYPDAGGKPDLKPKAKAVISESEKCLDCGKGLIQRLGKKGKFWGCSGYPSCKTLYQDLKGKPKYD